MLNTIKPSLFLLIFFLFSCTTTSADNKVISIEGFIEIPIVGQTEKYLVTNSSFFLMSKEPNISFEIMEEDEIKHLGSDKSPYDFLKSSLINPTGEIEKAFNYTFREYTFEQINKDSFEIFVLRNNDDIKAFIYSKHVPFVLDLSINGNDADIFLKQILNELKLARKI